MGQLNFGVKIYLKTAVTPDANLGLYDESGVSVFRWSSDTVSTTDTYKTGILSENFINDISQFADIRTGGNQATIQGTSIGVDNTSKFWDSVEDLDISFIGSKVEIFVIDNEVAHAGTYANETKIYYGKCSDPVYTAGEYVINVSDVYEGRNAQTGKVITSDLEVDENGVSLVDEDSIGKMIPITYGKHEKAVFQKVKGRNNLKVDVSAYVTETGSVYPVTSQPTSTDRTTFTITIGVDWSDKTGLGTYLNGIINEDALFFRITKGLGSGDIRKVSSITLQDGTSGRVAEIDIVTDRGFSDLKAGTGFGTDADLSWGYFQDIRWNYKSDFWDLPEVEINTPKIISNGVYVDLPESTGTWNKTKSNEFIFDPKIIGDNPNTLDGYSSIAVDDFTYTTSDYADWLPSAGTLTSVTGSKFLTDQSLITPNWSYSNGDFARSESGYDTNQGSMLNTATLTKTATGSYDDKFYSIYKINLPDINDKIDVSSVVLCLFGDTQRTPSNPSMLMSAKIGLYSKNWLGVPDELFSDTHVGNTQGAGRIAEFRCFPDWKDLVSTDKQFWEKAEAVTYSPADVGMTIRGVYYDLGVGSIEEYRSLGELAIIIEHDFSFSVNTGDTISIVEYFTGCSIAYKTSADVSTRVYAPSLGRGVSPSDPTENKGAINTLKMIKNLQNWSDASISTPTSGWGLKPVSGLIDETTGSGGFANADLSTFSFDIMDCSRQILDVKESETKELSRSLCKNYSLMSWVSPDGYESICQIARKTGNSITQTVNRADILGQITVSERKSNEIYCQPTIYYDYNYGLDKWNKTINVSNVTEALATDQEKIDTVSGDFTDAQKLDIWERCRALYVRYGIINKAPSDLSELKWIRNKNTAYACMVMFLENQGAIKTGASTYAVVPRLFYTFTMDYSEYLAKGLKMGSRFYLNHPYYTNSGNAECLIHGVRISPRRMEVTINALGYDATANYSPAYQNTNNNLNPNWQNTNNNANTNYENTNQGF